MKNYYLTGFLSGKTKLKWGRIMRLTLFLMIGFLISASANSYSQSTRLDVQFKNGTVAELMKYIEENSEFVFLYKNEDLNTRHELSFDLADATIHEVLEAAFSNQNLEWDVYDRQIVLRKSKLPLEILQTAKQQQTISGIVTDQQGLPLPGVTVIAKGTTIGTVTDNNGNFTFSIPLDVEALQFSFVGMRTQEVPVDGRTTFTVVLQEETIGMDEVVVIGYGTRQRRDLTGAVSQIDSDEITRQNTLSPQMAMQGRMPGVFISNPGSDPTARPTVRIRGVSTLGFNDPLYVVDGIPLTEGGASSGSDRVQDLRGNVNVFSMINPNDIESISVLKDASATAIYGVRASNGVILITTKRGAEGKTHINMSARYGIQNVWKRYEMATMQEYVDWSLEAADNNPAYSPEWHRPLFVSSSPEYMGNSRNYTNDWADAAIQQNAPVQDYNLSVSGGNQTSTFAAGAGYANQQNVFHASEFDRYSLFFNSDHNLTPWLTVGESYRLVYTQTASEPGTTLSTMFGVPWQPIYDTNGPEGFAVPGRTVAGTFQPYGYGPATRNNFLGEAQFNQTERDLLRNLGTAYAEIKPFKGLRLRGTISVDYYTNVQETYEEMNTGYFEVSRGTPYPQSTGNLYRRRLNDNLNFVKEFLIGYTNSFGNHNVDLVLNAMDQRVYWDNTQMSVDRNSPITNWDQRRLEEGWGAEDKRIFYERSRSGLQGYMGRLSYHYNSTYYLDATVRRDGTSKFGPGYKWGTFPSFAAAWRVSSESFMQGLSWLDDLKIRAGWGQTGNQETRDYAFLSLVNMNPKAGFGDAANPGEGNVYPASALGDFPVEDMSWETVTTTNIGFDAVMLENKLGFTAEYYHRLTEGILQTITIPKVIGALTNPVINLAEVQNKGFEFQLNYNDTYEGLRYDISANLTTVNNIVENLYRGQPSTSGNLRIEEGHSINFIYGYRTDGLFQSEQEVAEYQQNITDPGYDAQKSPGDVRFVDLFGPPAEDAPEGVYKSNEPDGVINSFDQTYLGKTVPGYYYGINIGLGYQNWDASLNFRGVGDVQRINTLGKQTINGFGNHFLADYRDRWTENNTNTHIPRAVQNDPANNNRISDRHVEDAGFFRFQEFQIGYTVAAPKISDFGISNLRLFVSGSNIFVISPYNDLDPEDITTPTVFSVGANLSF